MKNLYILRHAKSDWGDADLDDHDRPLAPRGERGATVVGVYLRQRQILPELILCSTATRAMETRALMLAQLGDERTTEFDRALYLSGRKGVMRRLAEIGDGYDSAMVIGHNPDLHDVARALADGGDPELRARLEAKLPTAGFVEIALKIDSWSRIDGAHGSLVDVQSPKTLV
jgi:phosphohistidine phosphatase